MTELARYEIHRGRDPFTLPQTKVDWVATSIPGIKQPVIRYKFMNSEISLILEGPDETDVKAALRGCLQEAAVISLVAGIVGGYAAGGTAGVAAGVAAFATTVDSCLESKLKRELNVTAEMRNSSHWDQNWS